jgi:hypothetical protein
LINIAHLVVNSFANIRTESGRQSAVLLCRRSAQQETKHCNKNVGVATSACSPS